MKQCSELCFFYFSASVSIFLFFLVLHYIQIKVISLRMVWFLYLLVSFLVGNKLLFYLIPASYNGALLYLVILEIIKKAESIGLFVHSITTDMGPNNLAMWRTFLVGFAGRYSTVTNSMIYPVDNIASFGLLLILAIF